MAEALHILTYFACTHELSTELTNGEPGWVLSFTDCTLNIFEQYTRIHLHFGFLIILLITTSVLAQCIARHRCQLWRFASGRTCTWVRSEAVGDNKALG